MVAQLLYIVIALGLLYLLVDGLIHYKAPELCGRPCPECGHLCEYHADMPHSDHGHLIPGRRFYPKYHTWSDGMGRIDRYP